MLFLSQERVFSLLEVKAEQCEELDGYHSQPRITLLEEEQLCISASRVFQVITTQSKSQPFLRQLIESLLEAARNLEPKEALDKGHNTAFCSHSCCAAHGAALLLLHHHNDVSEETRIAPCWGGCAKHCLAAFCPYSLTRKNFFFFLHLVQQWNRSMKMGHIKIWGMASASCCSPQSRE